MRVYRRKKGDILQGQRFPWPVVVGLKSKPREWSGQYQQEPSPQSGIIFNPAWWRYFKSDALPELELTVLSVDCAFKSGKENDLVAIHKWGMVGPRSYLLERQAEHLGYVATKAAIRSMRLHGRAASTILVEDKANGSAIIEELKSDPDFGAAVIAIDPQGDKKSRAHAASTDCEAGNVYLPENAEWLGSFLRTAAAFPAVRFDDDIDAMSQFLNWRRGRSTSLTFVDYCKRIAREIAEGVRDFYGDLVHKPEPKPVAVALIKAKPVEQARVDGYERLRAKPELCPVCQTMNKGQHPDGHFKTLCKQCGAVNDVLQVRPIENNTCPVEGCGLKLGPTGGGYCANHGQVPNPVPVVAGMTFQEYNKRRKRFW